MAVPSWFYYIILLILGLVLGSFYNVCIYRLPREESIVWPGSRCPHCRHPLSVMDNLAAGKLFAIKRVMSILSDPNFISISLGRRNDRSGHGPDRLEVRPFLGLPSGLDFSQRPVDCFLYRFIPSNNPRLDNLSRNRDWFDFFLADWALPAGGLL